MTSLTTKSPANLPPGVSSRREALKTAVAGLAGMSVLAGPDVLAAPPVKRDGKSKMKLSLAGYSFNGMMVKRGTPEEIAKAEMTLEKFIHYCAGLGLDGTELTGYYFPREITTEYLLKLKQLAFRMGLDVSGTAIGNDFCHPDGEKRDAQLAMCREWIDYAAILGAPVIRIFAGKVPKGGTESEAVERCSAGINESLKYAATKGVFLALENHGGITATPAQMMKIIERIDDSPWFGVNYDSGNFRTDDPYRDLAKIAPYAVNAQIKVTVTVDGKKQPSDLKRMVDILKDAGYRGYVVLEYEENNPMEEIPKYIDQLRDLIA